jgi:hypothetical protein
MLTYRNGRAASLLLAILMAAVLLAGAVLPESRAFQVAVFAAMLAALWGTGSRLARWLVPDWSVLSRLVAAFTFAVAVAVVPATWMGHFGVLRPGVFLAWTAAAYLLSRFFPLPGTGTKPVPESSGQSTSTRWSRIELALLIAATIAIAMLGAADMFRLRLAPAGPYGFDDNSYHLSEVATWIRHGDLRMIRFSVGDASTPFYPVLGEVSSWVLIAPFQDSDVAARWTQIPFALFSFLAMAAIARRLGMSPRSAALAALLFAAIHRVWPVLALGAGNDHSLSFFTLAAVDGGLALARRPRPGAAVATGAALGLLLATKYIGILFAPVLIGVLAVAWFVEKRQANSEENLPLKVAAGLAGLLAAALAVTAAYTYLRNAVSTGNPIFPAPVRLFGFEIFPGWEVASLSHRDSAPEFQIDVWHFLTGRRVLFGPFFPLTMLPAAVLGPLVALWRRKWVTALVFSLPAVFFLQFLYLMHDHRDMRYFLPGVALAAVAFVWLLDSFGSSTLPFRALLLAVMTYQVSRRLGLSDLREVLITLAVLGLAVLVERATWRRQVDLPPWIGKWGWLAAAGLVAILALPLGWAIETYQEVKLTQDPAASALESLVGPRGARVAYVGLNRPYLFFGSRLQNDVQIVPRSWRLESQYYRWGTPIAQDPFEATTYRRWRKILDRLGIEWVLVTRTDWNDPERSWIARRTDHFRLVYVDADAEIWRVLPATKGARPRGPGDPPAPGRRAGEEASDPGAGSGSSSSGRSGRDRG